MSDNKPISEEDRYFREGSDLIMKNCYFGDQPEPALNEEEIKIGMLKIRKSLEIITDYWPSYFLLGKGYQALKKAQDAFDCFFKSAQLYHQTPPEEPCADLFSELCHEALILKKYKLAYDSVKIAFKMRNDVEMKSNFALAALYFGKDEEAETLIQECLAERPQDEIVLNVQKMIYFKKKYDYLPDLENFGLSPQEFEEEKDD